MGTMVQNIRTKNPFFFQSVDFVGQTRRVVNLRGWEEVETLIETLPDPDDGDVTLPADVKPATEAVNEYHRQVFKLNEHFKTIVNKDSARSKFDLHDAR